MTEHSLYPAYVAFHSHSSHGVHNQIIPTRAWNDVPLVPGNTGGSYTNWLDLPCDGQLMIEGLVDKMKLFYKTAFMFDSATIYTMADENAPAIPRAVVPLGVAGSLSTGWDKATQAQWMFRDTEYHLSKVLMLDYSNDGNWDPISTTAGHAEAADFVGAITSTSWAWASRAGFRPQTFTKLTYKLNDKLRERYGMA